MLSKEHLVHLIWTARVSPDVSESERKCADLDLLALLDSSGHVGDDLVHIVTTRTTDVVVRFNAVLALSGVIRRHGLLCFADKDTAIVTISNYLLHSFDTSDKMEVKLISCCADVLSLVIIKDSDARWPSFLDQCLHWACQGNIGAAWFLRSLSEVAKENASIWGLLASNGVNLFVAALTNTSPVLSTVRLSILHFFVNLLSHRPRPVASGSISCADSTLLSAKNRVFFVKLFCHMCTGTLPSACTSSSVDVLTAESAWLEFAAVSRITGLLLNTAEMTRIAFTAAVAALRTLHNYVQTHATPCCDKRDEAVYSLLECMTVCLQIFPHECACGLEELLLLLSPFVTNLTITELDVQSKLLFMEEELVPIGCLSDDVQSLALSVIELALDENMGTMHAFLNSTLSFCKNGNGDESVFLFTFLVLRSINRVLDYEDYVFVDYFDPECLSAVLQTLVDFTQHGTHASTITWMTCIDVFSMCFSKPGETGLPFGFLKGVAQLWDAVAQTPRSVEERSYLLSACLVIVGRYVELTCTLSSEDTEVSPMFFQKALEITAESPCTFAVYAGSLVLSLFTKIREWKHILTVDQALLGNALTKACLEGVERTVAKNVSAFLDNVLQLEDSSFAHPCATYLTNLVLNTVASAPLRYNHLLRYLCEYSNRVMHALIVQRAKGGSCCSSGSATAFNVVVVRMVEPLMHLLPILVLEDGMSRASSLFFAQYATICTVEGLFAYSPVPALHSTVALLQRSGIDSGSVNTRNALCASVVQQLLLCEDLNVLTSVQEGIILYVGGEASHPIVAMGACLLYNMIAAYSPQFVYQSCGNSWWCTLQTSWCALAPFMDAVTLRCTLTTWSVLLFDFFAFPRDVQRQLLLEPTLHVPHFLFPSPYIKRIPTPKGNVHVLVRIILALYDVKNRWERSPKVNLIPSMFLEFAEGHDMPFFLLDKVGVARYTTHEALSSVDELVHFFEFSTSAELTQLVGQHLHA